MTSPTAPDPAFKDLNKSSPAFLIWRVEKLQLAPVPKEQYGHFYSGDSYIVYSATSLGGEDVKLRGNNNKVVLDIHIHFWLGKLTSQDESGVAAYKSVELDDYLGGSPVQHREVQGHESKRFLSYFKTGIALLEGGVASGFTHVVDTFTPRMFQVKGRRRPTVQQTPSIEWENMNNGDVYIIETKECIIVWIGKFSNNMEKLQAAKVAQKFKSDHGRGNVLIVEDGEENNLSGTEKDYFNMLLPLDKKNVKDHTKAESDDVIEEKTVSALKLYKCSDNDGTLKVVEVKGGPLIQTDLNSDDTYIIDNGSNGIWVWVGKKASSKERVEGMRNAQGFIKKKNYKNHTPVTRIIDGAEPVEFKSLFKSWKEKDQSSGFGRPTSRGSVATSVHTKFDAASLHSNPRMAAKVNMVDDGSGKKKVWRVEKLELKEVTDRDVGTFYSGDCYVIFYEYETGQIIYYWIGNHSSQDEKVTAAKKAVDLDEEHGGTPIQIRVTQGKEPPHFMAIFQGKLVILKGGVGSGFKNVQEESTSGPGESYMLQVHGTSHMNTKAVQVEKRAASLNSNDVFVLFAREQTFIWAGKGSTGDEREVAKQVAAMKTRDPVVLYEGQERDDFWRAIGGKETYSSDKPLQEENPSRHPRLFQCSNAYAQFRVEEIFDFDQSDLMEDDVMMLDVTHALYLWYGKSSNKDEQRLALEMVEDYLKKDPSGRSLDTSVVIVKQGFEPPTFTGYFGVWDTALWNNNMSFEDLKKQLQNENKGITMPVLPEEVNLRQKKQTDNEVPVVTERFSLVELRGKVPSGVDPSYKELYLNDEEFQKAFGMSQEDFQKLPQWKKVSLKKNSGLF